MGLFNPYKLLISVKHNNLFHSVLIATCFDSVESSSGLPENRSNVSKFIVPSGIPNAYKYNT
jgi:hypothetical protein